MKILLLSDVNSPHTQKLVRGLTLQQHDVGVFSLSSRTKDWYNELPRVTVFDQGGFGNEMFSGSPVRKLAYLKKIRLLKKVIREFRPDIIHAHYATSYGMMGWLSGFHPFVLSTWGSDVLDFPQKNVASRRLVRRILIAADVLTATSRTLEKGVKDICGRKSVVVPFGIDTGIFHPFSVKRNVPGDTLVYGTIKSLEKVYRIDLLIESFAALLKEVQGIPMHLLLVGDGTEREALVALVDRLGIKAQVTFTGRVDHSAVAGYHNRIDVFMNLSTNESFGVSVLEAMACEKPVIVSNTGGPAEIVDEGIDGLKVAAGDVGATVAAMKKLATDVLLRKKMGEAGRKKVERDYEWKNTIAGFEALYTRVITEKTHK